MKIGVVGLGLIGGSVAMAYKAAGHVVYGYDTDSTILGYAKLSGVIDDALSSERYPLCDLIILAATPKAMVSYIAENASAIPSSVLVMDFCGVKEEICSVGFEAAARYGFTYVGGHPMAGLQYSGFKHARATLFNGASMIIVPPVLMLAYGVPDSFIYLAFTVGLGEVVCAGFMGSGLYYLLKRNNLQWLK